MNTEVILVDKRLDGMLAYATEHSAGIDLRACSVKVCGTFMPLTDADTYTLQPGEQVEVGSGIRIHIGSHEWMKEDDSAVLAGMLIPRSGMGTKHRLRLSNTVGLIDADYQGEVIMVYENGGSEPFTIKPLERLAQLVIVPVIRTGFDIVSEFSEGTERGTGGFGSTGTK